MSRPPGGPSVATCDAETAFDVESAGDPNRRAALLAWGHVGKLGRLPAPAPSVSERNRRVRGLRITLPHRLYPVYRLRVNRRDEVVSTWIWQDRREGRGPRPPTAPPL